MKEVNFARDECQANGGSNFGKYKVGDRGG